MAKVGDAYVTVSPNADKFFIKLTEDMEKLSAKDPDKTKIKITPELDKDAWKKEQEDWQKQADEDAKQGKGPKQKVRMTPDDSESAKRAFNKELRALAEKGNRKIEVKVDADTARAQAQIAALSGGQVTVDVKAQMSPEQDRKMREDMQRRQAAIQQELNRGAQQARQRDPQAAPVNLRLNRSSVKTVRDEINQALAVLKREGLTDLDVNLKSAGVTAFRDELDGLDKQIDKLGKKKLKLGIELGEGGDTQLDDLLNGWGSEEWDTGEKSFYKEVYIYPKFAHRYDEKGNNEFTRAMRDLTRERDVLVKLKPDVDEGFQELLDYLDKFDFEGERERSVKVHAEIEGAKNLPAMLQALEDLDDERTITLRVDVDDAELTKLKAKLAEMKTADKIDVSVKDLANIPADPKTRREVTVDVSVNGKQDLAALAEQLKLLSQLRERKVNVGVSVTGMADLVALSAALEAVPDEKVIKVRYERETDKPEGAVAQVAAVVSGTAEVRELNKAIRDLPVSKTVPVKANTGDAKRNVASLKTALNALPKSKTATVKVNTGVAKRDVESLKKAIQSLPTQHTVTVGYARDKDFDLADVTGLPDVSQKRIEFTTVGGKDAKALVDAVDKVPATKPVKVKAEVVGQPALTQLKQKIASLAKTHYAKVKVTVAGLKELAALRAALKALPNERQITIKANSDSLEDLDERIGNVRDNWSAFKKEFYDGLNERVEMWAEVDTALAEAQLDALTRDRTVKIQPIVDGDFDLAPQLGERDRRGTAHADTTQARQLRATEQLVESSQQIQQAVETDLTDSDTRRVEVADRTIREFRDELTPDLRMDYQKIGETISKARVRDGGLVDRARAERYLSAIKDKIKAIEEHAAYVVQNERRRGQRRFVQAADMFDSAVLGEELAHNKLKGSVRRRNEERFRNELAWQRALGDLASERMVIERARSSVTDVDNVSMDVINDRLRRAHAELGKASGRNSEEGARPRLLPVAVERHEALESLSTDLKHDLEYLTGKRGKRTGLGFIGDEYGPERPWSGRDSGDWREWRASNVLPGRRDRNKADADWARFGANLERMSRGWEGMARRAFAPRSYDGRISGMTKAGLRSLLSAPGAAGRGLGSLLSKSGGKAGGAASKLPMPDTDTLKSIGKSTGGLVDKMPGIDQATGGGKGGMKLGKAGWGAIAQGLGSAAISAEKMKLGLGAIGAVAGTVGESLAGFSAMAVAALKPVAQSFQLIAGAPAVLAGAAAGIGTVAIGVRGLGEAFKNMDDPAAFAAALEGLAPSAREFATAVKEVAPAWGELQSSIQDNLFDGMAESFTRASDALMPIFDAKWPKLASEIGDLGDTVLNTLGSPEVARQISSAFDGITEGFAAMKPGMESFTEGLVRMVDVGARELLPSLGRGFSKLGENFNDFFDEDRISNWIETGKRGFTEVSGLIGDMAVGLKDFMGGMAAGADAAFGEGGVWGAMRGAIKDFRDFTTSDVGQARIADFFQGATETAQQVWDISKQWGSAFVNDVMPAAREFMDKHGDTIGNIGEDLIQMTSRFTESIGPVVEMIAPLLDKANGLAKRMGMETPEEKAAGELSDSLGDLNKTRSRVKNRMDDIKGTTTPGNAKHGKAQDEMREAISQGNQMLQDNVAQAHTQEWQNLNREVAQSKIQFEQLRGAFDGTKQTMDATSSVMQALGSAIVDVPSEKEIVVKGEGTEQVRAQLEDMGAQVHDLEDGTFSIEFENAMEIQGALQQIQSQMRDMPEAEIKARGLDVIAQQLAEAKAQMDGMGDAEFSVNVDASQLDDVKAKLAGIEGVSEVNGSVYIDTNAPEVQAKLLEIGAAEINKEGQFQIHSNAAEVIAEFLGIDAKTVTAMMNVVQTGDTEPPADSESTHTRNAVNTGEEPQPDSSSTHTRNAVNTGAAPPGDSSSTHVRNIINRVSNHVVGMGAVTAGLANGGVVRAAADGFATRQAMVAPKGSYILWAENETEDESYIPHALSKRKRSTQILAETAEKFGLGLVNSNGEPVVRDGTKVTPMAKGGVAYGDPRRRKLSEEARRKAKADAEKKAKEKQLSPAERSESARLEAQIKNVQKRRQNKDEGYARKLVGYKNGMFIYADADLDDENLVRSVDRRGLIPENVRITSTIEDWDDLDPRSKGMLKALDSDKFDREYQVKADQAQAWAQQQGLSKRDAAMVRAAVDGAMPATELPDDVREALITGEKVSRKDRWHRDIDEDKLFEAKNDFSEFNVRQFGMYLQGEYGDQLADAIGLNARIQRDVPLYNLLNPDEDAWNAMIGDAQAGQQTIERKYNKQYQEEREVMRKAQEAERDRQKARDEAEKKARKPDQLRKELERELARERDDQAQHAAGMNAVREHRAAMAKQSQGQGVVVNQNIGTITASNAMDAANQFRRKTMVGFENLTGVI